MSIFHDPQIKLYHISSFSIFNYVSYNMKNGIVLPWATLSSGKVITSDHVP